MAGGGYWSVQIGAAFTSVTLTNFSPIHFMTQVPCSPPGVEGLKFKQDLSEKGPRAAKRANMDRGWIVLGRTE
jgi:hypothetical protein